jgi:NodT family efflux transporter outer membrane factor (OMF) lipoprotein
MPNRIARNLISAAAASALAACAVGPNYVRPSTPTAPAYKEQGWNPAQPGDMIPRGAWWTIFDDPALTALEQRVAVSNQNVAAAEAAYRQASAAVREQRAAFFPTLDLSGGATRSGGGSGGAVVTTPGGGGTSIVSGRGQGSTTYRASVGATWEPDVWGRIRRSVESARGAAQASEADLAAATLSAQATLATSYFQLRQTDLEIALLTQVSKGYERSLQIARNRYQQGVAAKSDLLQAQSQLASAQADLASLTGTRATLEHAIAVLVGETPSSFSLPADPKWRAALPQIPAGVPSTLLQRRPDIAAAERRAASASAQIGVETAAWFPSLTLTGSYGFAANELSGLLGASSSVWSLGVSAAQLLFDGGATNARIKGARAAYDQAVAEYRQTVLAAFQDVEDQLASQRTLAREYELRRQAAADADQAATILLNQYKEGQVGYTDVVTAQASALTARRTLVQAAGARRATAVTLVQALGGGWTAAF